MCMLAPLDVGLWTRPFLANWKEVGKGLVTRDYQKETWMMSTAHPFTEPWLCGMENVGGKVIFDRFVRCILLHRKLYVGTSQVRSCAYHLEGMCLFKTHTRSNG